ncbi:hypothetical protein JCM3765_000186 [Sporobolomyces pararoseus]
MDLGSPSSSSSALSPAAQSNSKSTRKITSCNPCRLSKVRCDGQKPCSTCVKKRASEGCIYRDSEIRKAAALAKKREKNENKDLRSEVERLQKLVNVLVDARLETISSPSTSAVSPQSPQSSTSVPLVPQAVLPPSSEEDLAERLFNLTISSFSTNSTSTSPSNELPTRRVELIDEVEYYPPITHFAEN